jgi:hypothetical protein
MPLNDKQIRDAFIDCKAAAATQQMHFEVLTQMIHAAFRETHGPVMNPGTVHALSTVIDYLNKIAEPGARTFVEHVEKVLEELDAPAVRPVD